MISKQSFKKPETLVDSSWLEHAPFAFWLVEKHRPKLTVELGSFNGFSFFCFCQELSESQIDGQAVAIDTWEGDKHADFYGEEVYRSVKAIRDKKYPDMAILIRSRFEDAVAQFKDSSIDLLHIDGLHTYEAVKNDYETWLPKLSDSGIILFHDTQVRDADFGVWKLWSEISGKHPSFEFLHGHGLGVLCVGNLVQPEIISLTNATNEEKEYIRTAYSNLGEKVPLIKNHIDIETRNKTIIEQINYIQELEKACAERLNVINNLEENRIDLQRRLDVLQPRDLRN